MSALALQDVSGQAGDTDVMDPGTHRQMAERKTTAGGLQGTSLTSYVHQMQRTTVSRIRTPRVCERLVLLHGVEQCRDAITKRFSSKWGNLGFEGVLHNTAVCSSHDLCRRVVLHHITTPWRSVSSCLMIISKV